jgi:hypothetical protein
MEFLLLKNSTRKPSFKKVKPGRMTQMVEHLPSKHEDLSSIPNTGKKWSQKKNMGQDKSIKKITGDTWQTANDM